MFALHRRITYNKLFSKRPLIIYKSYLSEIISNTLNKCKFFTCLLKDAYPIRHVRKAVRQLLIKLNVKCYNPTVLKYNLKCYISFQSF